MPLNRKGTDMQGERPAMSRTLQKCPLICYALPYRLSRTESCESCVAENLACSWGISRANKQMDPKRAASDQTRTQRSVLQTTPVENAQCIRLARILGRIRLPLQQAVFRISSILTRRSWNQTGNTHSQNRWCQVAL